MAPWRLGARYLSASAAPNPQQNTDSRRARIFYVLHPLAGQTLAIRSRRRGPPPTYLLATESGEVFSVPVWMTEPGAANLRGEKRARLHVHALLELAALTKEALESVGLSEEILPSDQAKESPREDRTTPVDIDTGSAPVRTAAVSRGTGKVRRARRDDARPPRPRGSGKRGDGGGSR